MCPAAAAAAGPGPNAARVLTNFVAVVFTCQQHFFNWFRLACPVLSCTVLSCAIMCSAPLPCQPGMSFMSSNVCSTLYVCVRVSVWVCTLPQLLTPFRETWAKPIPLAQSSNPWPVSALYALGAALLHTRNAHMICLGSKHRIFIALAVYFYRRVLHFQFPVACYFSSCILFFFS